MQIDNHLARIADVLGYLTPDQQDVIRRELAGYALSAAVDQRVVEEAMRVYHRPD